MNKLKWQQKLFLVSNFKKKKKNEVQLECHFRECSKNSKRLVNYSFFFRFLIKKGPSALATVSVEKKNVLVKLKFCFKSSFFKF
jgi:hypothetical protein